MTLASDARMCAGVRRRAGGSRARACVSMCECVCVCALYLSFLLSLALCMKYKIYVCLNACMFVVDYTTCVRGYACNEKCRESFEKLEECATNSRTLQGRGSHGAPPGPDQVI